MANDPKQRPTPRPRRRRTDIDPNTPTPKVANERRRRRSSTPAADAPVEPAEAPIASTHQLDPEPADAAPTRVFHLPGGVSFARRSAGADHPDATTDADQPAPPPVTPPTEATPDPLPGPSATVATTGTVASASADQRVPVPDAAPALGDVPSWLDRLDDRSPDAHVCPFLRSARDGGLGAPIESPDASNRCAALRDVVPQSLRQQELVCLSSGHVSCPRYLRGSAVAVETPVPVVRARRTLSPAILGSMLLVVMAFSASVAFVLARGGLELSGGFPAVGASPSPTTVAAVTPSPAAATPAPTASPSPPPTPSATPPATPTPTPGPTPEPTAAPTPVPAPTSSRYALLTACPDAARCWIYRVRSGDNLFSIANYFGVSLDSIYDRNPWVRQSGLRAGQELRLPPPTR